MSSSSQVTGSAGHALDTINVLSGIQQLTHIQLGDLRFRNPVAFIVTGLLQPVQCSVLVRDLQMGALAIAKCRNTQVGLLSTTLPVQNGNQAFLLMFEGLAAVMQTLFFRLYRLNGCLDIQRQFSQV